MRLSLINCKNKVVTKKINLQQLQNFNETPTFHLFARLKDVSNGIYLVQFEDSAAGLELLGEFLLQQ